MNRLYASLYYIEDTLVPVAADQIQHLNSDSGTARTPKRSPNRDPYYALATTKTKEKVVVSRKSVVCTH